MKKTKNKLIALILSLATAVAVVPALYSNAETSTLTKTVTNESEIVSGLTTTKSADWTDDQLTQLSIQLEELKESTGRTPNILFLGSLCSAHSLTKETIKASLNTAAAYGNVDYHLFASGWTGVQQSYSPITGSITMGNTTGADSINIQMDKEMHTVLYSFADVLANNNMHKNGTKEEPYDFVIMEFDGLRMGHTDYSAKLFKTDGTYDTDLNNLIAASKYLKNYYDDDKIAWIICDKTNSDYAKKGAYVNKYYFNEWFFDNQQEAATDNCQTNVRNCVYLLAPEDVKYDQINSKATNVVERTGIIGTIEDQAKLKERATVTETYYKSGTSTKIAERGKIWVTYSDAEHVRILLNERLGKPYTIEIKDVVNPGFTDITVTGEYKTPGGENWTKISSTDTAKFSYTTSTAATGTTVKGKFNLSEIYDTETKSFTSENASNVRMVINGNLKVTDSSKSGYIFTKDNGFTVDTNVGKAEVNYNVGAFKSVEELDSPEVQRLDKYTIAYDLKGGTLGDKTNPTEYTYATDSFTLNNPTRAGFIFKGWTGGVITGTEDPSDVTDATTVTVAQGSTGNRKYVANWSPAFSITKSASDKIAVGGTISYTINVTNNMPVAATDVVVQDTLPQGISSITYTGADDYDATNNSWKISSIAAGETAQINFTATAPESAKAGDTCTNKARVTGYGTNLIAEADQPSAEATTAITKSAVKKAKIDTDKDAVWTTTGKELDINLTEHTQPLTTDTPKILFLGTLCNAHSMQKESVTKALAAASKYGDVDYHLFKRIYNSKEVTDKSGKFDMGTTLSDVTTELNSTQLTKGYHSSLYDFAGVLADVSVDDYDYIVLEFDGMRLGHFRINKYPSDTDKANLNKAAALMKEMYAEGKVAWIIPDPANKATATYSDTDQQDDKENSYIYNDYFFDHDDTYYFTNVHTNVRETLKLLAPEDLGEDGEVKADSTIDDQSNLIARVTATGDDKIYVYYDDSDQVRIFLDEQLGNHVNINDIVVEGLDIGSTTSSGKVYYSIKGQYKKKTETGFETEWTDIDSSKTVNTDNLEDGKKPDGTQLSYTVTKDEDDNTVVAADFDLTEIYEGYSYGNEGYVQLLISCTVDQTKSKDIFTYDSTNKNYKIDTNAEDAEITLVGGGDTVTNKEETPTLTTPAVNVSYIYTGTVPRKTGSTDPIDPPEGETMPQYAIHTVTAPTEVTGYVFDGWYLDVSCTTSPYPVDGKSIEEATTIYGKWSGATDTEYKVEHYFENANDDGFTLDSTKTETLQGTTDSTATATPLTNVDGFTYDSGNANNVISKSIEPDGSTVLKVYYARDKYNVSYSYVDSTDGTKVPSSPSTLPTAAAYKQGQTVSVEAAASATGYDFNGWTCTSPAITKDTTSFTMPMANVDIVGSFNEHKATLTYDDNGGSGGPGTQVLKYSEEAKISTTNPTRAGYIFMGWAESASATEASYAGDNTYKEANVEPEDDTLYAVWKDGIDLKKAVSKTLALPGDELVYTVTVTNLTSQTLSDVIVKDNVPSDLEEYNDTTNDTNIIAASGNATELTKQWTVKSLESLKSATITFTMKIPKTAAADTEYENFAIATGFNEVTIAEGKQPKSNTITTTVNKHKTISVTKAWSDGWDNHSSDVVAVKLYTNDVEQSDVIELSSTNKSWSKIVATLDSESKAIKYEFKELDASGNPVADGAAYGGYTSSYSVTGNDTKITNIYQVKPEDLTFTKKINTNKDSIEAKAGATATYTISITNTKENEGEIAKDLKIIDSIPDGLTVQGTPTKTTGTLAKSGNDYTWTIPSLAPKATATLTFTVKIPDGVTAAQYVNKAQLTELYGKTLTTAKDTNETKINVRSFEVSKVWKEQDGTDMSDEVVAKQPAVLVTLKQNGTKYGDTKTLNASGNWKYKWEELPLNDASGNAYEYTVEETAITGYTGEVSYTTTDEDYGNIVAKITNTYGPAISKTVDKTSAKSGDTLTYTITLTNTSADDIELYTVEDTLDSNLEFQSAEYGSTTLGATGEHIDGQKLTIAGLTIPKKTDSLDGKLVITVTAKVKTLTKNETIKNTATGTDNDNKGKKLSASTPDVPAYPTWAVTYDYVGTAPKAAVKPTDTKDYTEIDNKATVKEQTAVPGWEFSGWYKDAELEHAVAVGDQLTLTGSKTLYGAWTCKIEPSKTVNKTEVKGGEDLTYKIEVKNSSTQEVTGYVITDKLENRLIYKSSALTTDAEAGNLGNPSYDEDSKTVTATDVTIPAGKTVTLEIVATLDPFLTPSEASTNLTNEATVNPNTGDKTITVKADPVKPTPKAVTVKYEYKKAKDTDPLPDGLSAPADVTSGVKYGDSYETEARQTAQGWSFEGWYYYDKDNIKTILDDEDELVLTKGNIKSLEDTNVVTLYGTWTYNVTLSKTVNKTTDVKGGDDIEYTITASNASPTAVTNYKIEDILDSRLTYKSSKLESTEAGAVAGTVSTDGQKISAKGLKIPAEGSVTLKITATVTAALTADDAKTKVENTAKGTPNNNDPPKEAPAPPVEIAPRGITINYHYVDTGLGHNPAGATLPEETTKDYGSDYKTEDKSTTALTYDSWYTFSGWYQSYDEESKTFTKPVSGTNALTTDNFGTLATSSTIDLYGAWTAVDSYSVSKDVEYNDKSIADDEALANSTVAYSVTLKNDSPAETRNITVVDKLPEGLDVVATSISDSGVLNPDKDRIIWSLTIGPSETKVLTFNATVPEDIEEPTEYKNIAFVNTVEEEPYDGPGSETPEKPSDKGPGEVTFTGIPIVKLGVKKLWSDGWDDHGLVTVGLFKNEGNSPLKTIDLADDSIHTEILPAYEKGVSEYSPVEYSFKEIVDSRAAEDGSVKTVTVNDKPADYMVNYTDDEVDEFVVTTITNTYQVGPEDLVVGKSAKNDEVDIKKIEAGDEFSYKITVNNTRTDVGVKDVVVEDNVPEGLEIGTIESDENNIVEVSGQKISWTVKELEKSGTATLIIPVKVIDERDAAEFTNVAKVSEIGGSVVDEPEKPSSNEVKTELRNFTVSKEWYQYNKEKKTTETEPLEDASEQAAVKVTLMRSVNGGKETAVGDAVELSESNNWKHKWTKLDMYDADGNLYAYTAKEADIAGYSSSTVYASTGAYGNTRATLKNLQGSRAVSYEFIAGGGPPIGMTTPPAETVAYAEKYTAADKPSADGYVFDGWFTEPEAENKFVDGTAITENTVLYGKWTPIKYKISYELEGGELKSGSNPATYTADDPDITLNNPTKDGFKFVGWTGTDLETETLTVLIPHGSIGDRQYKAVWEPLNHDISYDKPKDGPYDPEKPEFTEPTTETYPRYTRLIVDPNAGIWVHDGKTYQAPVEFILDHDINVEKPVREGFVFLGWDRFILDEGLTVKLVARWTPDQIGTDDPDNPDKPDGIPDIYQKKVTFQIKHGEWEDETIEDIVAVVNLLDEDGNLDPNGSASISIPQGMKPDEGFSPENGAWDEEPEIVVSGTDDLVYLYSYDPVYIFRPVEDKEDTTIKVEIGEKIRVNPNGGKWKHLGRVHYRTTTIVIDEDTKINDATRKGFKFMGWSSSIGRDGIVTLTAQWKSLGVKTGDSNDLNNFLFSGMFALIAAALVMIWRKRGGIGLDGGGLKLQLEGEPAKYEPVKPEPVKTTKPVQKENKTYMGWYNINDDFKPVDIETASEQKTELPDVIEGHDFVIKIKK